jgi:SAM-dependent methyltransferase
MIITKFPAYYSIPRVEIEPLLPEVLGSVLEIGCGTGATMSWLRNIRSVSYALGVEVVPEVAAKARSIFDEVITGNIETEILNTSRQFDVVIALDVLEHLIDPWGMVRLLGKLLKPDGVFIASIPNVSHWSVSANLFFRGSWEYKVDGILDQTHLRFFTERTALSLFEDDCFCVEKIDYSESYPGNSSKSRWRIKRIIGPLIPMRFIKFQFLIRARKIH